MVLCFCDSVHADESDTSRKIPDYLKAKGSGSIVVDSVGMNPHAHLGARGVDVSRQKKAHVEQKAVPMPVPDAHEIADALQKRIDAEKEIAIDKARRDVMVPAKRLEPVQPDVPVPVSAHI